MVTIAATTEDLDWLGEFRDPAREALFRRTMRAHDACQLRHALVVAAGLFLAFGLTDYSLLGSSHDFWLLLAMRCGVALMLLLLALAVSHRPALAQAPLPVNLACLLGISGLLLTIPLRPDGILISLASLVAASMSLYLFIPNRVPWMLAGNAFLMGGLLVAMWLWSTLPIGILANSLLLLGFVNLLCWMTVTRLHRLQRAQFASLADARSVNRELAAELEERSTLERRLRHMARTDELTGIANRRHFFELAEQARGEAHRDGTPLSLCMVDIDHFKAINDRHGHAVGDLALRVVAARCQSVLRDGDHLGRYGGEEFVIALPQACSITAGGIAERIREAVSRQPLEINGVILTLTVTLGISCVEPGEGSLDPGLLRADRALYEGKARGRNCVVTTPGSLAAGRSRGAAPAPMPDRAAATVAAAAPAAALAGGRLPDRS